MTLPPIRCPYCKSTDIQGMSFDLVEEVDDGLIDCAEVNTCNACHKDFEVHSQWRLHGYEVKNLETMEWSDAVEEGMA